MKNEFNMKKHIRTYTSIKSLEFTNNFITNEIPNSLQYFDCITANEQEKKPIKEKNVTHTIKNTVGYSGWYAILGEGRE